MAAKERLLADSIKQLKDFREEISYLLGRYEYLKDKALNKIEAKEFRGLVGKIKRCAGKISAPAKPGVPRGIGKHG